MISSFEESLTLSARSVYVQINDNETMLSRIGAGSGGGASVYESVQTMLDDFEEPMIAGKTHAEVLAMSKQQRHQWYNKIIPQEKDEAIMFVETKRREKISKSKMGHEVSKDARKKISESWTEERKGGFSKDRTGWKHPFYGKHHSEEAKRKMSEVHKGENNPSKRPENRARFSENNPMKRSEVRAKISGDNSASKRPEVRAKQSGAAKERWKNPEYRAIMSETFRGENNPTKRPEVREKISKSLKGKCLSEEHKHKMSKAFRGENNPRWRGGISFEPYCPKFNYTRKESTRNEYGRTCALCGETEILHGERLLVHHVDADKTQGCEGKKWVLVPLCRPCHSRIHGAKEDEQVEYEFVLITNRRG